MDGAGAPPIRLGSFKQSKPLTVFEVLPGEVGDQGGFSAPCLSEDVHVGAAVATLNAESAAMVAEVCCGEHAELVFVFPLRHKG